jgi:hypothetical protein
VFEMQKEVANAWLSLNRIEGFHSMELHYELYMLFSSSTVTTMGIIQQLSVLVSLVSLFSCLLHINAAVSRPVVQDPAFVGVGTEPGLRIWRIEVNSVP